MSERWRDSYDAWKLENPWDDAERREDDENPSYGPGNPDWEYDRAREDAA